MDKVTHCQRVSHSSDDFDVSRSEFMDCENTEDGRIIPAPDLINYSQSNYVQSWY